MIKKFLKKIFIILVYIFLYMPILILIINSFNESKYGINWNKFTTKWYLILIQNDSLIDATKNSIIIGVLSASISTLIGLIISIILYYNNYWKKFIISMIFITIISPDIITAISFLLFFNILNIPLGFWSLLLSHITFSLPFSITTINSRLKNFDNKIIEAAQDLGANTINIIKKIIIPIAKPGIISGWLLSFTISIDDVIISSFVSGAHFEILPIKIFSMVKVGISPEINALGSVLFITTTILIIINYLITKNKN